MLEPPDLQNAEIIECLQAAYSISIEDVAFMPLGADFDTVVYRVLADDGEQFFLKLRRAPFSEATVTVPYWLVQAGIRQLISPIPTRTTGSLWAPLPPFSVILYPFVNGRSGWEMDLSPDQWAELGTALHTLHTAALPADLLRAIPQEDYAPIWRDRVRAFLWQVAQCTFDDPVAAALARFLQARHATIEHIIDRAEQLASELVSQSLELCLCHGDIHAGNVLIGPGNQIYMVDWDTLIIAPKERDLMFIGGGVGGIWRGGREEGWFYQGYGQVEVKWAALAYYRYERVVRDVAETCEYLWERSEEGEDRAVVLDQLASHFETGGAVDIAHRTDRSRNMRT